MKKYRSIFSILLFVLTFLGMGTLSMAETSHQQEIDIATTPEKVLFDLSNMKPGDWAERTIIILNKGKQDFNYLASKSFKTGSKELYNVLKLKITDQKKVLFEGDLKDFNKLDPRFIAKNNTEHLLFRIDFPKDSGNEFQGLNCEVEFKFYVEGTLGGIVPVDGPKLPETGTKMFNFLLSGAIIALCGIFLQIAIIIGRKFRTSKP